MNIEDNNYNYKNVLLKVDEDLLTANNTTFEDALDGFAETGIEAVDVYDLPSNLQHSNAYLDAAWMLKNINTSIDALVEAGYVDAEVAENTDTLALAEQYIKDMGEINDIVQDRVVNYFNTL